MTNSPKLRENEQVDFVAFQQIMEALSYYTPHISLSSGGDDTKQLKQYTVLSELISSAYNEVKMEKEYPSLRDVKAFHFAINNVFQPWMSNPVPNDVKAEIVSKEMTIAEPSSSQEHVVFEQQAAEISFSNSTTEAPNSFSVQSRDHMKQLIVKYLDLVEHRKFALINKGLEKKEQKCREMKSQMTKYHPEINK
jgi:hypothetical protein